jgi:hypothetical protein
MISHENACERKRGQQRFIKLHGGMRISYSVAGVYYGSFFEMPLTIQYLPCWRDANASAGSESKANVKVFPADYSTGSNRSRLRCSMIVSRPPMTYCLK